MKVSYRVHPTIEILVRKTESEKEIDFHFTPLSAIGTAMGFWVKVPDHLKTHVTTLWP